MDLDRDNSLVMFDLPREQNQKLSCGQQPLFSNINSREFQVKLIICKGRPLHWSIEVDGRTEEDNVTWKIDSEILMLLSVQSFIASWSSHSSLSTLSIEHENNNYTSLSLNLAIKQFKKEFSCSGGWVKKYNMSEPASRPISEYDWWGC